MCFLTTVQVPTALTIIKQQTGLINPSLQSSLPIDPTHDMSEDMAKVHLSNAVMTVWAGDNYSSVLLEQIATMVKKEDAFYSCVDYIGELPELDNDSIDGEWRQMAAEWMFRVIDFYDLDREIVSQC